MAKKIDVSKLWPSRKYLTTLSTNLRHPILGSNPLALTPDHRKRKRDEPVDEDTCQQQADLVISIAHRMIGLGGDVLKKALVSKPDERATILKAELLGFFVSSMATLTSPSPPTPAATSSALILSPTPVASLPASIDTFSPSAASPTIPARSIQQPGQLTTKEFVFESIWDLFEELHDEQPDHAIFGPSEYGKFQAPFDRTGHDVSFEEEDWSFRLEN